LSPETGFSSTGAALEGKANPVKQSMNPKTVGNLMNSAWLAPTSLYALSTTLKPMRNAFIYIILILECVKLKIAWSFTSHLPNPVWSVIKYLGQWLPLYTGLALQISLVLGLMLGLAQISRSRELDAMSALGQSLHQILAPVFMFTAVVACCVLAIIGWLQPLMLYQSASFIHDVEQSSVLITEGSEMFRIMDNKTVLIDGVARDGKQFERVFIYEVYPDGKTVTTAGTQGKLTGDGKLSDSHYFVNNLDLLEVKNTEDTKYSKAFSVTRSVNVQGPLNIVGDLDFRKRGNNEYEYTFPELYSGGDYLFNNNVPTASLNAEINYRFAQLFFILLFPFIAVVAVVEPRRNPGPMRFLGGLLFVLAFNQYLSMGTNISRNAILPPAITLWLPLALVTITVGYLFWKIAYTPAFKTAR
jgi:lipopolysaccharide export system permease protein